MAPSRTSPIAQMPATLVRKCASVITRRLESRLTPTSSSPSPSVYGRRPMATSIASASIVSRAPPAAGSMAASRISPRLSTATTLLASLNFMPCRSSKVRSEEHTSELQSLTNLVCRLLLEKKKKNIRTKYTETSHMPSSASNKKKTQFNYIKQMAASKIVISEYINRQNRVASHEEEVQLK